MAGDLGSAGKAAKAPVSGNQTSGKPQGNGAPSGSGSFKGSRPSPTAGRSKGPR